MNNLIKSDIQKFETTDLTPIEIALGVDEKGRTTAKKLYEFLELNSAVYSRWCRDKIIKNEFAEKGRDYEVLNNDVENPQGGRPTTDYKLSATFAKKLAMRAHNHKGELAKEYFITAEEKLKDVALNYSKLSYEDMMIRQLQEQKKMKTQIKETKDEVTQLKSDMPLFNVECKEIQALVRKTGIKELGGYRSPAYIDNSIRGKVYADIQHQLKREFGVNRYEAIKRCQFQKAKEIVHAYKAPTVLQDQIFALNNQVTVEDVI